MRNWYSVQLVTFDDNHTHDYATFYMGSEDGTFILHHNLSIEEGEETLNSLYKEIAEPKEEFSTNIFNPKIKYHSLYGYGRE